MGQHKRHHQPATQLESDGGFTILEVMVAFAILSIGMLGVGTMFMSSMQSDRYSTEMRFGDFYAMDRTELLKAQAVDSSLVNDDGVFKDAFKYDVKVYQDNPTSGMDRIDITVGWGGDDCKDDISKCERTTKISSFVPRSGL